MPGLVHVIDPTALLSAPVPAFAGPLVTIPPDGQTVEDDNVPLPPWQMVTPVVEGPAFTVAKTAVLEELVHPLLEASA